MKEKDVECKLCKAVRDFWGFALKLNNPGPGGYPTGCFFS